MDFKGKFLFNWMGTDYQRPMELTIHRLRIAVDIVSNWGFFASKVCGKCGNGLCIGAVGLCEETSFTQLGAQSSLNCISSKVDPIWLRTLGTIYNGPIRHIQASKVQDHDM